MARRPRMAAAAARTGRRLRRPSHQFQLRTKFWQLQPFVVAPVLPAETMKNALFMSRVVSDPLANPLIGAHKEYWLFYVRLRDLAGSEDFEAMMLDPQKDMSAHMSAASVALYHSYGINWVKLALDKITQHYFRADDEWDLSTDADLIGAIDGLPATSLNKRTWMDSLIPSSEFNPITDVDVDANADSTITVGEIDEAQRNFAILRQFGLTSMDFDDYLKTFGIAVKEAESDKPELLRYASEWTYPTNTIDPASGAPSSALSWSISDRADKDRFFREPGFIIGVTSTRPKVYLSNQKGSVTGLMHNAIRWLPALMADDPYTSLVEIAGANGPVQNNSEGYVFDIRDLLLYGEQYVNFALNDTSGGLIPMPTAGLEKRYPTEAMGTALFKTAEKNLIREDGIINFSILGSQHDTTPPVSALNVMG